MSNQKVAKTILKQMGGMGRLRMMISAHNFAAEDNALSFHFKGSRTVNVCKVVLEPSDTYRMELWHINSRTFETEKRSDIDGLYFDMLVNTFEEETGLFLSI